MSEWSGASQHVSVLPQEVTAYLQAATGGAFLDCTLGGGGHAALLLAANAQNTVLAIDRDPLAIARGRERFLPLVSRIEIHHAAFSNLLEVCGDRRFNGMLADLGTSSDQLGEGRGFSFLDEGPLDMRMDSTQEKTAHTVVNFYPERELFEVLRRGGVGGEARAISRAVARARPLATTAALAAVIAEATPARLKKSGFHPATVPFQAIRIEVNDEFAEIESLLSTSLELLESKGRLAIISFHSGEDRVVTQTMRQWEQGDATPSWWRGSRENKTERRATSGLASRREKVSSGCSVGVLVTRKAVQPQANEVECNPRARSARLRVFEFH